jgi:N4-gp56 family major capsid protein
MVTYYEKMMLDRLKKTLIFHGFGQSKNLPANNGKLVQWHRRTLQAADTSTISEGVVPSPITLSGTSITAQLSQYGNFTQTSDLLDMTSIDPEIEVAVDDLSYMAALTLDTLDRNLVDAGTNIQYANGKAALSATAAADVLTLSEVRKAVRNLAANDVRPFEAGEFRAAVHPNSAYDLQSDTATGGWNEVNTYVNTENRINGEIGKVHGTRFAESTNVSFTATGTSGSANVYSSHIFGAGAFGVVNYDGGIHIYVKRPGDSDTSNPLNQYSTVGYKLTYANAFLDQNRQVTVKAGSAF